MRDLKEDMRHSGYSQEEAYFDRVNRDLIERIKERRKREEEAKLRASPDDEHHEAVPLKKAA